MLTANPYELVAHLMLDGHLCPDGCLCAKLREVPQIQEAIRQIENAPTPKIE